MKFSNDSQGQVIISHHFIWFTKWADLSLGFFAAADHTVLRKTGNKGSCFEGRRAEIRINKSIDRLFTYV